MLGDVLVSAQRFARLAALGALCFYCLLLLVAALPGRLIPALQVPALTAGFVLHLVGITPGMEVFAGRTAPRAIPRMSCFRITGEGTRSVVLYDDLELCQRGEVQALRDPWRVMQMRNLSEALVHVNLGGGGGLDQDPLRSLFLITDYYCHLPQAEQAGVERVVIESSYWGMNLDDGSVGEVRMGGERICAAPRWTERRL